MDEKDDRFERISYSSFKNAGKGLASSAYITPDGRINVSLDLKQKLPDLPKEHARDVEEFAVDPSQWRDVPKMSIVILIVGSRGDVQPYVALGKRLINDGHRVRIASHETFRSFVNDAGLEFFDIGGDPQDLMSYMVKNPGLVPGMDSLMNGDIGRKRKMLREMISGCWMACHAPCPETGVLFAADAIISNPPAFAHVHCAEALGIPLQLTFTMPWSPTTAFPHPLVNVSQSNAEEGLTNYLTYPMAEIMTWQGIGDIINQFRKKSLGLQPLSLRSGPGLPEALQIPWTYCMSPALVPKPHDWKNNIDVVGFYFLDLASNYTPPDDLATFLASGPAPLYIGFGSVVVDDPTAMSKTIFEATKQAGMRALVSAGWGGLGGVSVPDHVFILGNIPHDWLFADGRVAAVIHHGGAGTTAAGLSNGLPTLVVPFFGDQGFWGNMIHRAGAGPEPIAPKKLDVEQLTEAIKTLVSPAVKAAAGRMAEKIKNDNGLSKGVESFYRHLPLKNMRCDLDPSKLAVWWSTEHCLKLSAFAAQCLADGHRLRLDNLELHRSKEYNSRKPITDPISGGGSAIFWTVTHYYAGIAEIFYSPVKGVIHTTTAIPKGVMMIISSVSEGFHNAPKLYGSEVRATGKVTNFASGLKEGGKGVFYGYCDGITGLVREPLEGAKKGGFVGAIKGAGRSFVNVTMKPAAGIVGMIAHPMQGLWKSVQPDVSAPMEITQRGTRVAQGADDVKHSTQQERNWILKKFEEASKTTQERRENITALAQQALKEETAPPMPDPVASPPSYSETSSDTGTSSKSFAIDHRGTSSPVTEPPSSSSQGTGILNVSVDYDEAFLRDVELARHMSQTSLSEEDKQFEKDLEAAKALSVADLSR